MTYSAKEQSVHGGSPIELFEFTQGAEVWRYTSRSKNVSWGGYTWLAAPIKRTDIELQKEINKANVTLEFPISNAFASQFLGYGVDMPTIVRILRGHSTDPDAEFIVYWPGRVTSSRPEGSAISIECESVFTSMRMLGLRERFQFSCRHVVYGRGCKVNKDDFAVAGTASAVSGVLVTVAAAAGHADGYFRGGMLLHGLTLRYVINHVGTGLTLSRPIPSLLTAFAESGDLSVTIWPGCDGSEETCNGRFDNLDNHGGFRRIPSKNPMSGGSIV